MKLFAIDGNTQKLDGGAMYGNAPRAVWEAWSPPDAKNRIDLACRALLVETDDGRRILFEAGIGAFFEPKLRERFGVVESEHLLVKNLAAVGVSPEQIDSVVLSHLHFDHAGGVLSAWGDGETRLVFPRAKFYVGRTHWERARHPHARDRASFIPGLVELLEATGRVEQVSGERSEILGDGYRFHRSEGHTPGLLLAEVAMPAGPVVFAADLIPGKAWVHLPITMGYDRYPEMLIDEKTTLLTDLLARHGRLFFTHDPVVAMGTLARDAKGKFGITEELGDVRDLAS